MGKSPQPQRNRVGGIEQVSLAVSQMDSVTQQNAALVEESAAAAASLEQQAEQLRLAVAAFRITRDTSNSEHRKPPKDAPQAASAGSTTQDPHWETF